MKLLRVDFYVVESLMRDLVGHDKKPSAFIVYLYLWSRLSALRSKKVQTSHQSIADDTGLSKSAVQMAVRHLLRRRLVRSESASPTSTPTYSLLRPWRRSASRKLVSAALLFLFSMESIAQSAAVGNITGTMRRGSAAVPAAIVVIADRDGRIRRTTRTNAQGQFAFSDMPAGSYVMQGCSGQFGPSLPNTAELKTSVNVSVELTIDSDSAGPNATSCAADFTSDASVSRRAREYTGSMMSTDLKGDLREFFRSIAAITDVQLDVDPSINGAVAVHLKNIPADLALDAVLSTSGLGSELDGKVLRIRTANPALGQDRVLMGTVTIVGTIAEVDIQNPRVQFHVNAPNTDGATQAWPIEWERPEYLREIGIAPNVLNPGDKVLITGSVTRTNTIRLISIQRPSDGFSWGFLAPVRAVLSDGTMFVSLLPQ